MEWEGFREAADDVAYVTTLVNAINQAEASGGERAKQARAAQEWLNSGDPGGDLAEILQEIIRRIMLLN